MELEHQSDNYPHEIIENTRKRVLIMREMKPFRFEIVIRRINISSYSPLGLLNSLILSAAHYLRIVGTVMLLLTVGDCTSLWNCEFHASIILYMRFGEV